MQANFSFAYSAVIIPASIAIAVAVSIASPVTILM
jgi:hypothetical protein